LKKLNWLATAAKGTEAFLAEELEDLGAEAVTAGRGIVSFKGDVELCWTVNLQSRVAMRVLKPLAEFDSPTGDALYEGMKKIRWSEYLTNSHTLAVDATVEDTPELTHSHFVALKAKDAIVDQLRDELGARPSVNPSDPDVAVVLRVKANRCWLSLNTSGEPLFKRGYRVRTVGAPLKETLAAAILLSTTYGGRRPLVDPMCGSGTLAIEAALIATRRAPGRHRSFAFQRWPSFGQTQAKRWREILAEADEDVLARAPGPLFASDMADDAVAAAQANAQTAKVFTSIEFARKDVRAVKATNPPGLLVMNPPYGERIGGKGEELGSLYKSMGERLAQMKGHDIYILVPVELDAKEAFGMEPLESVEFWNGPIETRLVHFKPG
jgi:23S rRNA G2445 N2-methylase RlmL